MYVFPIKFPPKFYALPQGNAHVFHLFSCFFVWFLIFSIMLAESHSAASVFFLLFWPASNFTTTHAQSPRLSGVGEGSLSFAQHFLYSISKPMPSGMGC
jgi:hypothetical protein